MITRLALLASLASSAALSAQDLFDQGAYRDFRFTFAQADWWNQLLATRSSGADIKADLTVDGTTYKDVGIRIKGASSASVSTNKRPFNLTMDAFVPGQELYGFSTLNLNNGAYDPTMTRETIAYRIFRDFIPAPRTNYIRLHFNGSFWGAYILIEQPNQDMLREWFLDTRGTRYKADSPGGTRINSSTLNYLGGTPANYQGNYELKTPNHANAWTDLVDMITKLNQLPNATFKQEIVKVLNVDRALWYLACNNAVINSDDYMGAGHNYYMYFDPLNGQMNMIPWDNNEAFGVHGPSTNPWLYSTTTGSTASNRPLTQRLLAVPEWRELYFAHYRTVVKRWIDWPNVLEPLNRRFQDVIRTDVANEPYYLFNKTYFAPSFPGRIFFNGHYVHGLQEVCINRAAYLKSLPDISKPEPQLSDARYPQAASAGQKVQVTVKVTGNPVITAVVLRSTDTGRFVEDPMFDDGQHGDGNAGDGIFGGSFTAGRAGLPTRFYVHATDSAGTVQVLPAAAAHECFSVQVAFPTGSDLVINEILADNETGDMDNAGERDDWIELHNRGTKSFDASGCYLSDDLFAPKKWQLPANTVIPAGGFLRIWCDDQAAQGPYHASFKLAKQGETLVLTDTDANSNRLLDGVTYPQQKADRAFGRVPDGRRDLFYVWTPSGGGPITGQGPGPTANDKVRFDSRRTGPANGMDLLPSGSAKSGGILTFSIFNGPVNSPALIGLGLDIRPFALGPIGTLFLDPTAMVTVAVALDPSGFGGISGQVPALPSEVTIYAQAATDQLSNGVIVRLSR